MRFLLIVAFALFSTVAGAQQMSQQQMDAIHRTPLDERFYNANTTHDGHLTREQARGKMPNVYIYYSAIDTQHKGYVTLDEIKAYIVSQTSFDKPHRGGR